MNHLLWLLQSNDTGYPSGGYAHSFGLEELVAAGIVYDETSLLRFLQKQVLPNLLLFELPYFALAHSAADRGDAEEMLKLDKELDAWRIPAELRDAGRRIGSQRLALLAELSGEDFILNFHQRCPRSHHLVVSALEFRKTKVGDGARAYTYQAIVSATSASMKLMRIGQNACQRVLTAALMEIEPQIDDCLGQKVRAHFNPLLEIASLRHAHAHERLFIS